MELVKINLQDGHGDIVVAVGNLVDAYRLRQFAELATESITNAEFHYERGYRAAIAYAKRSVEKMYGVAA